MKVRMAVLGGFFVLLTVTWASGFGLKLPHRERSHSVTSAPTTMIVRIDIVA